MNFNIEMLLSSHTKIPIISCQKLRDQSRNDDQVYTPHACTHTTIDRIFSQIRFNPVNDHARHTEYRFASIYA